MKKIIFLIFVFFISISFKPENDFLFFGIATDGFPITKNKLQNIQNEIGMKPDILVFYLMWPKKEDIKKPFNIVFSLNSCLEFDAIPCITWEPMFLQNNKEQIILKDEILSGLYDKYLDEFIFQIKSFRHNVIIRFAHEMNLNRYHWGVQKSKYDSNAPDAYKQIFRYVVNYFKKNRADNVLFAFCPNADSVPMVSWNVIKNYFPGDEYVDILGIDGYNFGNCATMKNMGWTSSWKSFMQIFNDAYKQVKDLSYLKPIIIFETASASIGGDKNVWLENALKEAQEMGVSAITWFQVDKECDWKLTNTQKNILKNYFINKNYSIKDWIKENF